MNAIEVTDVTKTYRKYARRKQFATIKSAILSGTLVSDLNPDDTFHALKGVSFSVRARMYLRHRRQERIGQEHRAQSGGRHHEADDGDRVGAGPVSALIELGAGFHPEISGRENVFINGVMLGLTSARSARFDEIVDFAELDDFIDTPREDLLVGDVHAARLRDRGPRGSRRPADRRGAGRRRRGVPAPVRRQDPGVQPPRKTIVLVSHDLGSIERLCDEAVWLNDGRARAMGDPRRVVSTYITDVEKQEERHMAATDAKARAAIDQLDSSTPLAPSPPACPERADWLASRRAPRPQLPGDSSTGGSGCRAAQICFKLQRAAGARARPRNHRRRARWRDQSAHVFFSGERVEIRLAVNAATPLTDFVIGVGIFNVDGVCALRHQHEHRGGGGAGPSRGETDRHVPHPKPRPRGGQRQAGRRGAPARTAIRTTTTDCSTVSA